MAQIKSSQKFSKLVSPKHLTGALVLFAATFLIQPQFARALPFVPQASPPVEASNGTNSGAATSNRASAGAQVTQSASTPASATLFKVATFDSGFGGYFTAKEIEKRAALLSKTSGAHFQISHYGDTLNSPYGEKSFEQIAELSAQGIFKAFHDGAEKVYIACNTASTQVERISQILDEKQKGLSENIVSIIDVSSEALKQKIDKKLKTSNEAHILIFATPATLKAKAFPKALAKSYGLNFEDFEIKTAERERWYKAKSKTALNAWGSTRLLLKNGKKIEVTFMGPGNWVELIEHGADAKTKDEWMKKDLSFFKDTLKTNSNSFDVVGEFCTHYPAVHERIQQEGEILGLFSPQTEFIKQGPLMADLFEKFYAPKVRSVKGKSNGESARANIFISGTNVEETQSLVRTIFPEDPTPEVKQIEFK